MVDFNQKCCQYILSSQDKWCKSGIYFPKQKSQNELTLIFFSVNPTTTAINDIVAFLTGDRVGFNGSYCF